MIGRAGIVALALCAAVQPLRAAALADPPLREARGRGTMRSMVEGACQLERRSMEAAVAPSTTFGGIWTVAAAQPPLDSADNLPRDVARSISACWHAPHEGDEITLRLSFRRDGSVFGKPRITYMKAGGGPDGAADLATSIYAAISACTPLRFTPALGAAIAGRIFLIRFVAMRREQRAAL